MNLKYMELAYEEAIKAFHCDEVPIGAVIVKNDTLISKSHNKKNSANSSLAHAEVECIKDANILLDNWRLDDCDIYITLEPCPMCASLIHQSRIQNVYYATSKNDKNNYETISRIFNDNTANKCTNFYYVDCGKKYSQLLNDFFKKKR